MADTFLTLRDKEKSAGRGWFLRQIGLGAAAALLLILWCVPGLSQTVGSGAGGNKSTSETGAQTEVERLKNEVEELRSELEHLRAIVEKGSKENPVTQTTPENRA